MKHTPRIALFTHDTFGLGHVRRSLHLIKRLAQKLPDAPILLLTGSPALEFFKELPPHADLVKIPTVVKTGSQNSRPPHLPLDIKEVIRMRRAIIEKTLLCFAPDLFIVDNFPLGSNKELLKPLEALKKTGCKTILGIRDIVDAPEVVRKDWTKKNMYNILETYYDKILIYGLKEIFDSPKEYGFSQSLQEKCRFTGFITHTIPTKSAGRLQILATGGGGGDAYPLFDALLDTAAILPKKHFTIILGPLMGNQDKERLRLKSCSLKNVVLKDYLPDLGSHFANAEIVIGMCGYNSAAEIVSSGARAVIVPRTWRFGEHEKKNFVNEEKEQIFRGKMLANAGFATLLEQHLLSPETLRKAIETELSRKTQASRLPLEGLENAATEIMELLPK